MVATNGFFGSLEGPFESNVEIVNLIQNDCKDTIDYISKLGIYYIKNFDLDLQGIYWEPILVKINNIDFQIGRTGILELEDTEITSIKFINDTDDLMHIDYQYVKRL